MIIKSYSKINLTLKVLKKLRNGLHDIETNSVLINLFDELNIKKSQKDIVIFKGKFKNKINSKKNTVTDTLKILRNLKLINNFYKVVVKKNIPVYAGLGGGTGNAASIIQHFLKNKFHEKLIKNFEQKIGSDLRLFLNKCVFQKKLGEVFPTKNNISSPIIVVYPNINCKTKSIYKMVENFRVPSRSHYLKKVNEIKFITNIKRDQNDLQKIVEKKYPKVSRLIKLLDKQKGCTFSRMTGSGSACYGVFKSKKTAKLAFINLKRKYPNYWCVITKTI